MTVGSFCSFVSRLHRFPQGRTGPGSLARGMSPAPSRLLAQCTWHTSPFPWAASGEAGRSTVIWPRPGRKLVGASSLRHDSAYKSVLKAIKDERVSKVGMYTSKAIFCKNVFYGENQGPLFLLYKELLLEPRAIPGSHLSV